MMTTFSFHRIGAVALNPAGPNAQHQPQTEALRSQFLSGDLPPVNLLSLLVQVGDRRADIYNKMKD